MRRRLTVAIVGTVAGALLAAGLGTFLLATRGARADAVRQLVEEAQGLARRGSELAAIRPRLLRLVRTAAHLDGAELLPLRLDGTLAGRPPPGLSIRTLEPQKLLAGQTVSGIEGTLVYAAVPVPLVALAEMQVALGRPLGAVRPVAVVLTRRLHGAPLGGGYLALVSGATLVLAALVAARLGRRISRPLSDAVLATSRIAAGDLSARVEEAPRSDPELATLTRSINQMAESLARARGLERQFLLSVSHDLRTPLTSIRGYAEAILDGTAPDPARAAAVIASESRRLERLVRDLLELARLDARRFSLTLGETDLAEVVSASAEALRPLFEEAGLSLSVRTPQDRGLRALADPDRLAQVVSNLVENAYKFSARSVEVRLGTEGADALLEVRDDGPGIAPADLPHIFERLYQSQRTPARQAGSGLGLAIVAELVHAMGGRVEARSPIADGHGTALVVRLPLARSPATGTRVRKAAGQR